METKVRLNKQYRGQIMRTVARFYPTPITVKQIKLSLEEYGIRYKADIYKHLFYLEDKGYIKIKEETKDRDGLITITSLGIDLIEGTIEDNGILI